MPDELIAAHTARAAAHELPAVESREHPAVESHELPAVESLAHLLTHAEHPVVVLCSQVWTARATDAAVDLIRTLGLPAYADGAARGTLPPGDAQHFLHSRAYAFAGADVILVVGAPFDLRALRAGYGRRLAPHATIVQIDAGHVLRSVARAAAGLRFQERADRAAVRRKEWLDELRTAEQTAEALWQRHLTSDASPVHPFRLLAEIDRFLTEDSVFIADDPRSAELAGRLVRPRAPGHWMDPGPLGTAGAGIPFALAVHRSCADKETVVLFGDDPSTSATWDSEVLVRRHLPFVGVVAHSGGALFANRAPMYGMHAEDVRDPAAIRPALERARSSGGPALIGVRIDPDAYLPGSVNSPHHPSEQSDLNRQNDQSRNK
ncbi:thiamine pyrophosphate-dependent enzyme [Streptomyces sp. N35]|uniref:thiamine pyrophosphate-dependent enzyme n=1 Tax=Streptomyces sp. N35 TaxID=2795730 RepID=UPI0018F6CF5C|nr:thiamine pyrophosphate-dependent enzyme [Streptomyces sp. N35]